MTNLIIVKLIIVKFFRHENCGIAIIACGMAEKSNRPQLNALSFLIARHSKKLYNPMLRIFFTRSFYKVEFLH